MPSRRGLPLAAEDRCLHPMASAPPWLYSCLEQRGGWSSVPHIQIWIQGLSTAMLPHPLQGNPWAPMSPTPEARVQ